MFLSHPTTLFSASGLLRVSAVLLLAGCLWLAILWAIALP